MIVESRKIIFNIFELSQKHSEVFVIPVYQDNIIHPANNTLSLVYIACSNNDYIIPIDHPDSVIKFTTQQVFSILDKFSYIFVNDKKEFLHTFDIGYNKSKKVLDLNLSAWFKKNSPIDTAELTTNAHNFIERQYIGCCSTPIVLQILN